MDGSQLRQDWSRVSSVRGDVVICSFYTDDEYYRGWANKLRQNLDDLGIAYVLREVHKAEGLDWADICRQKVGFLEQVCEEHPDKRVFWTDVDCQLLDFPEYLHSFTADVIGFQHGFAGPMEIGYSAHTRFWAPSFIGVNTTPAARKFVADAARFERESAIKATDDYFFEESWRANADAMSFQVIPAGAVLGRGNGEVPAFYKFGSSGNVPEFRGRVVQHASPGAKSVDGRSSAAPSGGPHTRSSFAGGARSRVYRSLKSVDDLLLRVAPVTGDRIHEWAKLQPFIQRIKPSTPPQAHHTRAKLLARAVSLGQRGASSELERIATQLHDEGILSAAEEGALHAAASFAAYAAGLEDKSLPRVPLMWWPRPFPGNFGDWASPLIVSRTSGHGVTFVPPTAKTRQPHLVAVGSIARFVNEHSVVVGTGASADTADLDPRADYHSLRGPLTAALLRSHGGPTVESFGDPAVLLRRLMPLERTETNGRLLLVRHFTHANLPVTLAEDMDELSVLSSSPEDHLALLQHMHQYDGVITSAMHVMIACHSYGIPVALVTFRGFEDSVAGSGMKYRDYSLGAALDHVWEPSTIGMDMTRDNLRARLERALVSDEKLDEVQTALASAVASWRDIVA